VVYTPSVMLLSNAISVTALILELSAVLLLLRKGLWRVYTFLLGYAIWLFAANLALLLTDFSDVHRLNPLYPAVYWHIDSVDIVLRLLVIWEVFRQTFPKNSGLRRSLSKGLAMIAFMLLVLAGGTLWGYQNYNGLRSLRYDPRHTGSGPLLWCEVRPQHSGYSAWIWNLGFHFDGK
jgi:hypothetical protein